MRNTGLTALAVICFAVSLLIAPLTFAAAPKLMNYQGRLTTAGGTPVSDGFYTVRFRVYTDSTAGTSLWEETLPVQTAAGLFTVALGGSTVIPDTLFNSANRFLGLRVNADAELPRTRFSAVPFALESAQWTTTGGNAVRSGGVGIGTSAPARRLEVSDSGNVPVRITSHSTEAGGLELFTSGNNSTWFVGQVGSGGTTVPPKTFYLLRYGAVMPIIMVDSMNRMMVNAWPGFETQPHTRLWVGAQNDPEVTRAIEGRGTYAGVVGIANGYVGDGLRGYGMGESGTGVAGYGGTGEYSYGIYASCGAPGYAGYFYGNAYVNGTLSKTAGSFKIDHPIDPANKYLSHSFVESPDMMNIYNGNVTLDGNGEAVVSLPDWFSALNKDFRYQLTCIGGFAPVYIAQKISSNQFNIAGGTPGLEVSWMVTGIRQDAYANAHRIPVEETKADKERGYYQHPELFGQPEEKGIEWARRPEIMKQMKAEREKAANQ